MLLVINIGNTQVALAVFQAGRIIQRFGLKTAGIETPEQILEDLHRQARDEGFDLSGIVRCVIGSVVLERTAILAEAVRRLTGREPLVVDCRTPLPLRNSYADPAEVGVDRLADAVGAAVLYGPPALVVDIGTAITVEAVSLEKVYLGGAIAPGPELMIRSLASGTSRLKEVPLETPPGVIGRSTRRGIQSGVFYGMAGMIDGLIERFRREMKHPGAKVIFTGGWGGEFQRLCRVEGIHDPDLTLQGLRLIAEYQDGRENVPE